MSIEHWTYELRKSRLGAAFGDKVAIREDWIKRTRRYVVASGLDLNKLATFVKKGLYDRRTDQFNEKALSEPLSPAQQWTLMHIILSDFGVPEWLRDPAKDELTPEMEIAEPEEEDESVAAAIISAPVTVASGVATVTTSAVTGTIQAGKAVTDTALGVAATPVRALSDLVTGGASAVSEAEEAIQEVDEALTQQAQPVTEIVAETPAETPAESETPAEAIEEPPATEEDSGEDQGE